MATDACSKLAPVVSDYTPQGTWDTVAGLKTYTTGPPNPTRAIIDIYDIFGAAPQTLQGADRLSSALNCLVLVPDFFNGTPCNPAWVPPDTDEKKAALGQWRAERADAEANLAKVLEVRKEAGEKWKSVGERWGVFGLCWGGKLSVLVCGEGNEGEGRIFVVGGTAHPSRVDARDAEALTVPYICLASPGEPVDVIAQYKEILSKPGKIGHVETYETMFHGWMGARSKLDDEKNRSEYERGYKQIAEFLSKYL
ncbi:dienelactone hydrolase family protein [Pseudomassariella vexata]|uniref:Dienelactone hydrolase family protein n=1 Tax=Pseudomassariella vexata TaxID=1141098 RepID=A0A1Y2EIU1_9PEZI|nr:dienelactone hydrolase family protein [Pseudomassariella vexata]ORY71483.1 dienelactone hydrolase family protein [Pseudomassariella vexata]